MESCSNVVFFNNGDSYKNTLSNKNLLTCAALWHTFALTLQYINEKHIINFSTSTMIKLSKIIKFKEGITQHKEEELQKYSLKGWSVAGCSTQYIIVEKELDYDEAIMLEGYTNLVQKSHSFPAMYIVIQEGLLGFLDEYGDEILPCLFSRCDYKDTMESPSSCSSILMTTTDGIQYHWDRSTYELDVMNTALVNRWIEKSRYDSQRV